MSSTSSGTSSSPKAATSAPKASTRLTGKPATVTITVESDSRNAGNRAMRGSDAVTVILETDGRGHWWSPNMESPLFNSQAEAETWVTTEAIPDSEIVATDPAT
jgi:hypothetical protein